jgi:hypothetical protein
LNIVTLLFRLAVNRVLKSSLFSQLAWIESLAGCYKHKAGTPVWQ